MVMRYLEMSSLRQTVSEFFLRQNMRSDIVQDSGQQFEIVFLTMIPPHKRLAT